MTGPFKPEIIFVTVEPPVFLDEREFWRDVEATNRCDDPKKAKQFLSSLIVRRAYWEAIQKKIPSAYGQAWIETRARDLWVQCRSMGFPSLPVLGISITLSIKFPEMP